MNNYWKKVYFKNGISFSMSTFELSQETNHSIFDMIQNRYIELESVAPWHIDEENDQNIFVFTQKFLDELDGE